MSEAPAIFAIEDIILPLSYEATNAEHVHLMESFRDRLVAFLKAAGYSPKHKETSNPNPFRENALSNFAKLLVKEGLLDGTGTIVTWYDACDFVAWLYHGFKWLNAAVCEQYNKADGKQTPIMGFTKTVVDGATVITYTKNAKTVVAPSSNTDVDWSAWSGPQMIDPLQLRLSTFVTSHKKALYGFFPAIAASKTRDVVAKPSGATLADHIAVAKPAKSNTKKTRGGGAGGPE